MVFYGPLSLQRYLGALKDTQGIKGPRSALALRHLETFHVQDLSINIAP